ncbi:response regulator transcription factor [Faecalicatena contorta]|uniref:Stage 0 sporulation protein A homolog n=1 Tax=Faecalicatena fissicatena TaxID=290055 RepID=A0ABS2EBV6_9FIRM|nr:MULTISPECIES: response regulator transcription factor [Clostridia]MBM6684979.1 response regulator transcription factor [Faecalicatena contorta]MBM6710507.1 response regulator transcription factor [Faecalicatena contorta]MBM6739130.1 response regulator transcription factor [Faecalicatena fissicatena]HIY00047.1 response regulator transcription factor [Candidatus Dorea intestinigallinarum]
MDRKAKILVADDEKEIRQVLGMILAEEGYEVVTAGDGQEAARLASGDIDLYILDVNMPQMSGFAAGMEIRKSYYAPIMFLTAYSGEADKKMGFEAGADDYLVKPFSNGELLLRVKALLRRSGEYARMQRQSPAGEEELVYKDLRLDTDRQSVWKGEELIVLTYTEYRILELLIRHRKKIYSLDNIYQSVWEDEAVGDTTIMVHIKNIRKKLGDDSRNPRYIKTAWGKGYYAD